MSARPVTIPQRVGRALGAARDVGADAVLAADPATVTWLTGHAPAPRHASPFAMAPLAVVTGDGRPTLLVSDDEPVDETVVFGDVRAYEGYSMGELDPAGALRRAIAELAGGGRVATEPSALPAILAGDLDWVDAGTALSRARTIKDPDELELLRTAAGLCDAGQRRLREAVGPGITELELHAAVEAAVHAAAGEPVGIVASLLSGPRTALIGGPPSARRLEDDDIVMYDLAVSYRGYWGDSCVTLALGTAPPGLRARHRAACAALDDARGRVRPGLRAGDLDAAIRAFGDFAHHAGHGLGTSYHEMPRIVPGADCALLPGMVIALEPGSYDEREGLRVEQVVAVTETGCDLLSAHALDL